MYAQALQGLAFVRNLQRWTRAHCNSATFHFVYLRALMTEIQ